MKVYSASQNEIDFIKTSKFSEVETRINYLIENNNLDFIKLIVYQKHIRPVNLDDQYHLLGFISQKIQSPLNLKIKCDYRKRS